MQRILADSARTGTAHVLVVEEAHDLSKQTLKYLKRFWELEDGFRKLLGILLIAQPELAVRLEERRNPDLREFIRRCEIAHLRPLDAHLEDYLKLKFGRIGKDLPELFEAEAFDAIRARLTRRRPGTNDAESNVYPLCVHNTIVKAMNLAAQLGLPKISAELVGRV